MIIIIRRILCSTNTTLLIALSSSITKSTTPLCLLLEPIENISWLYTHTKLNIDVSGIILALHTAVSCVSADVNGMDSIFSYFLVLLGSV